MSITSLSDFNGVVPRCVRRLVGTDTVTAGGHPLVDQVKEVGTFAGHARGLSHGHDKVLGLLGRLHSVDLSDVPEARREDFTVPNRAALMVALQDRDRACETGPYGERARLLLCQRADEIAWLLNRYDALTVGAAAETDRLVLTHGEPHAANTIASPDGRMLIDWDTALIAPPERDLSMLLDPPASASAVPTAYSLARTVDVSRELLDLYRMLWDLMEIAGYVAFFRSPHSETADAAESWKNLSTYIDISSRWPTA